MIEISVELEKKKGMFDECTVFAKCKKVEDLDNFLERVKVIGKVRKNKRKEKSGFVTGV